MIIGLRTAMEPAIDLGIGVRGITASAGSTNKVTLTMDDGGVIGN